MAKKQGDKKGLSGRFAIFITLLLVVCTVVLLNNRFSSGSLRRVAYWIFNGVRADATEVTVSFDANNFNRFNLLSGNLCVVSPDEISVSKLSGKELFTSPVILRNPAISSSSSRFIAYDLGGLNFYVANKKGILFSDETESKIINANMNSQGAFSLITDSEDSKSLVTLYNSSFKPIYKFHSSDKYVFDAAISPNSKSAAILTYGTNNGEFESLFSLCKIDSDGFYAQATLGSSVPLSVSYHSDRKIFVTCDDRAILFGNDASVISEIPFDGLSMKAFDSEPGNHTAILLDNYENGGNTRVLFVGGDGTLTGSLDFDEDIYSISCAGDYTALQFSDKCAVYKKDMSLHCEFKTTADVSRCIANSDGSVICISNNFATLYVK